jgi:hypothetical protein
MREKICSRLSASRSRRGPTKKVDAFPRLKQQRGMRQEIPGRVKARGVHFPGSLPSSDVSSRSPSSLPSRLRGWLRLSLPLSLRCPIRPRGAIPHRSARCRPRALPTFLRPSQVKTPSRRSPSCPLAFSSPRPLHSTPALSPPRWLRNASPSPRQLPLRCPGGQREPAGRLEPADAGGDR